MRKKILISLGTRPEAIKLAPVIQEMRRRNRFDIIICATAQHREMLDQALGIFSIKPDHDLNLMMAEQTLEHLTAATIDGLSRLFAQERPDCIIVQGDTTTAFASALAAFYHKIPVAHIEAGLRTFRRYEPFPEEMNRRMISCLATWHFAPTETARRALLAENYASETVFTVGNTVIDALMLAAVKARADAAKFRARFAEINFERPMVLVTGHRRESFGDGFQNICRALLAFAKRNPKVEIVYPVHLNPHVQSPVRDLLSGIPNIHLIPPQDYLGFIWLLDSCKIVLTDSGGIQEEAPSLGKPVLVMRETTERPEAIKGGSALLVGTDKNKICHELQRLLDDRQAFRAMSKTRNPYGDGKASMRISGVLEKELASLGRRSADSFLSNIL